nr:putative integron gene cassette protein [uncultured bacterium]
MAIFRRLKTLVSDLSSVQCCFCGEPVRGEPPLEIHLALPGDSSQHMCAHGECFRAKLHPSVPFLTPAEHLEADGDS